MGYDKFSWHIDTQEEKSDIQASLIHGLIGLAEIRTGKKYKSILDVPCGNGRLHPYLKKLGYEIEGFDISEELVKEAKKKNKNCWVGNMMNPEDYKPRRYDVILNWFSSFGYWKTDKESLNVLEIWRNHLVKKGLLIISTATSHITFKPQIREIEKGVYEIMVNKSNRKKLNWLWGRIVVDKKDKLEVVAEMETYHRLYSIREMTRLLEKAGFQVLDVLEGNCLKRADDTNKPKMVTYLAIKH